MIQINNTKWCYVCYILIKYILVSKGPTTTSSAILLVLIYQIFYYYILLSYFMLFYVMYLYL